MPEQSEIQQAIAPIVRGIDKLEAQYERVINRIDNLPLLYMTRQEYEPRHVALEKLIEDLKDEIKALKQDQAEKERLFSANRIAIWIAIIEGVAAIALHFWK